MNYEELLKLKESLWTYIKEQEGIFGVGIGLKDSETRELALVILAESNEAVLKLKKSNLLEETAVRAPIVYSVDKRPSIDILYIKDYDEDDIASNASADFNMYRPLVGGIQLCERQGNQAWYGTLAGVVRSKDASDTNTYLLSNLHVFVQKGLECYQPINRGIYDVGQVIEDTDFTDTDAALALLNEDIEYAANIVQDIGEIQGYKELDPTDIGSRVIKRGRTTLVTEGTIELINADIWVSGQSGAVERKDCVCVRADSGKLFSTSGDSGSPVLLKEGKQLVGIHFAGNSTLGGTSYFCKMTNVMKNLNVELFPN